jgi:formate/nitrite transporter FocA (FNT family)
MAAPQRTPVPRRFEHRAQEEEEAAALGEREVAEPEAALGLTEGEQHEVERRTALRAVVVHEAIRKEGEDELERPVSALAWSGLAAGLSMGFSLVTEGLFRASLPDADWRPLLAKLGYPVGFLIVVLGRQQLFTENTLTVILPLLTRRNLRTLMRVARLWVVVLAANLVGALLFAAVVGHTNVFHDPVRRAFTEIGVESFDSGVFGIHVLRGIFAGWLIALMVWLLPSAGSNRMGVIIAITYVVGLARLSHVIAGSVEVLYLVTTCALPVRAFLGSYLLPTFLGNTIGGVSLVAALNHAQVVAGQRE